MKSPGVALPILALFLLGILPVTAQTDAVAVDGKVAVSALIALADSYINGAAIALESVAEGEDAKSGEWERIRPMLATLQKGIVPGAVWFARPDGTYFTVDKGLMDQSLRDRDYFASVMSGEKSVGTLVISKSTGQKSVVAAVPIATTNGVIGILGASLFLERMSDQLRKDVDLPEGMVFFALDSTGQTTLNWMPDRVFKEPAKMGSDSLARATEEMLSAAAGVAEYDFDGMHRKVVFATSPLTGWRFALGVTSGP
jgi:hypothetical protein